MIRALIIGVTGQDGSLLARNLLNRGIEVHGTFRRGSSDKFWRINELDIREEIKYHNYNIGSELAFSEVLRDSKPDLIFSLAGESFTALSFEEPMANSSMLTLPKQTMPARPTPSSATTCASNGLM